jgi:hypothetical protein
LARNDAICDSPMESLSNLEDYVSVENKRKARSGRCIQSNENTLSFHAVLRDKRQME